MKQNYTLEEVPQIAKKIIAGLTSNIALFYGDMGVGKTTLIKEILKQLKVVDNASSPTFSLVNEYHTKDTSKIYHFDFYRINSEEEALDIGIEEYFYSNHLCLIEWPNKIENLLPLNADKILITTSSNNSRQIEIN